MLAIGRALMARPRLLLLDEPSMGLAPRLVEQIFARDRRAAQAGPPSCWSSRTPQRPWPSPIAAMSWSRAAIALAGPAAALLADEQVKAAYLGL